VKSTIAIGTALLCAAVSLSAAVGEASPTAAPRVKHQAREAHHVSRAAAPLAKQGPNYAAVPPFSWLTRLFPNVKPYPPGHGDADGLSRNVEDCNKRCIDILIR
jgi:hypothetical protein